jgi:Ca2+-binding EF-hand superfamily protein
MDHNPFRYKDASELLSKEKKMTTTREELTEHFKEIDEDTLLMDGFDDACIGYSQRINEPVLAVYSYEKMIEVLMTRDGMDDEEAMEFIEFNCVGAWIGERTPIIVRSLLM